MFFVIMIYVSRHSFPLYKFNSQCSLKKHKIQVSLQRGSKEKLTFLDILLIGNCFGFPLFMILTFLFPYVNDK